MKERDFEKLLESIQEGGRILRGEEPPSRAFQLRPLDIASIRERYELTQKEFADLFGINVRTLQNWEQGRREPEGPAKVLLHVIAEHPEEVWDVVRRIA